MKGKTIVKSYFSVLLAVIMVITVMAPMSALAAIEFDTSKLGEDIYFTSRTDYVLAPGITETHITTNNAEGTNQIASYAVEVDLSNPTTSIIAGYKGFLDGSVSVFGYGRKRRGIPYDGRAYGNAPYHYA